MEKNINVLDELINQFRNSGSESDEDLHLAKKLSDVKTKISGNIIEAILFFKNNVVPLIDKNSDNMLIIRKMINAIDAIDE